MLSRLQLKPGGAAPAELGPDGPRAGSWRSVPATTGGRRTPHVADEYLEHFSTAVELDPGFALAHAGLAQGFLLAAEQRAYDPREALRRAEASALRALQLEPSLADAHLVTAAVAEAPLRPGRRARPVPAGPAARWINTHRAHERYSRLLSVLGRHPEAIAESPAGRWSWSRAAWGRAWPWRAALFMAGRPEEALGQVERHPPHLSPRGARRTI